MLFGIGWTIHIPRIYHDDRSRSQGQSHIVCLRLVKFAHDMFSFHMGFRHLTDDHLLACWRPIAYTYMSKTLNRMVCTSMECMNVEKKSERSMQILDCDYSTAPFSPHLPWLALQARLSMSGLPIDSGGSPGADCE